MRSARFAIFSHVDVLHHDVALAIDVVAEFTRVMVLVFGDDGIVTRRSRKALLPCGNGRFADQMFSLVKLGFLLGDMNNDAWLRRRAVVRSAADYCRKVDRRKRGNI